MKRAGNLFDRIVERENLRRAFHRACRGRRHLPTVRAFAANLDAQLHTMIEQLRAGDFPLGRMHQFMIRDPKERIITAPHWQERVLHHAIMNVCEPVFDRCQISDSYACRRGLGREKACRRAVYFATQHEWFLKADIRKYFDSISHDCMLDRLHHRFKDRPLLNLLERIIRSFRPTLRQGLPIGSLMSQHLANFYLEGLDRLVKEQLRISGYVRYMDDIALWSSDKQSLVSAQMNCTEYLRAELGLAFKPTPYQNGTSHGMDFLGARIFPYRALLNGRSRKRYGRKLRHLEMQFAEGTLTALELQQRLTSLTAFARAGGIRSCRFRAVVLSRMEGNGP